MSKEAMKLEAVYETIIQWDEGGGKRSRRELARRIVALAEQPAQQQEPAGWRPATFHRANLTFNPGLPDEQTVKFWELQGVEIEYCYTSPPASKHNNGVIAERQRIVNLLMIQHEAAKGAHNYWHVAAQLIQADVASDT